METEYQGRASEHIGLGWSEQSKENQIISDWADKRKARKLDRIGYRVGAGADPEESEKAEEGGRWEGRERTTAKEHFTGRRDN